VGILKTLGGCSYVDKLFINYILGNDLVAVCEIGLLQPTSKLIACLFKSFANAPILITANIQIDYIQNRLTQDMGDILIVKYYFIFSPLPVFNVSKIDVKNWTVYVCASCEGGRKFESQRPAKSYTALQTVRHRFNIYGGSCVALAQWRGDGYRKLVTRFGVTRRV